MVEISGTVEKLFDKTAKNGEAYVAIKLRGQKSGFFDWDGHYKQAEVKIGDAVKIEHNGGQFQRVSRIEKLKEGAAVDSVENHSYPDREISIARSIALKCSCELLKDGDMNCEPGYITSLSEKFEKWLLR